MENANVPLLCNTWRPILLCGLLLASKVWQDLRFIYNVFLLFVFLINFNLFIFLYNIILVLGIASFLKYIHNFRYKQLID